MSNKRKREEVLAEIFATAAKDFQQISVLLTKLASLDKPKKEPWNKEEIAAFEAALGKHGPEAIDKVVEAVPTRSRAEVRAEIQTYIAANHEIVAPFQKEEKEKEKEADSGSEKKGKQGKENGANPPAAKKQKTEPSTPTPSQKEKEKGNSGSAPSTPSSSQKKKSKKEKKEKSKKKDKKGKQMEESD